MKITTANRLLCFLASIVFLSFFQKKQQMLIKIVLYNYEVFDTGDKPSCGPVVQVYINNY